MNGNKCLICKVDDSKMPLIQFSFKGKTHHICTQHIPVLIHQASELSNLLPGLEDAPDTDTFV
ncbi:MAG TPA: hypothetical protein ENK91_15175 [Bacteroidetes bacterium]|nr:hypothetical protein [Bacteroidota bacterium]